MRSRSNMYTIRSTIGAVRVQEAARTTMACLRECFARIKGMVFDLDGTLYRQEPVRRGIAWRIVRAHLVQPLRGIRTVRILYAYRHAQETLRWAHVVVGDLFRQQI